MNYKPEGCIFGSASNQRYISTAEGLSEAMEKGIILEARVSVCDSSHNLLIDLPCAKGVILREEGAVGISEGKTRDIALITRVNKIVCFKVTELKLMDDGTIRAMLSRKAAQEECMREYISNLRSGDIIDARVTHLEQFGSFVDIGCGIPSLIPIDAMSVSRISHPSDRFTVGQLIRVIIKSNEDGRIFLTHKELLGTWEENAEGFSAGETVSGIVRSIEEYGIFVELTPNLAGLAEPKEGIVPGQSVSVYIKAILPEKMKVKLIIVDASFEKTAPAELKYYYDGSRIDTWKYSTQSSGRDIGTSFIDVPCAGL